MLSLVVMKGMLVVEWLFVGLTWSCDVAKGFNGVIAMCGDDMKFKLIEAYLQTSLL